MSEKKKKFRMVKCPRCEEQLDRNEEPFIEHSNRFYHEVCYNEMYPSQRDRAALLDYINELYYGKVSFPMVTKQIKEMIEEYDYSLKGIELSLRYFYDLKGNSIEKSKGVGIVPHIYEEVKEYYANLGRIARSVKDKDLNKTRTVVTKKEVKRKTPRRKIDIGGMEE